MKLNWYKEQLSENSWSTTKRNYIGKQINDLYRGGVFKMSMRNVVGRRVRITDPEQVYSTYAQWVEANGIDKQKWAYGKVPPKNAVGTVVHQGWHLTDCKYLYLVEINGQYYIIDISGVMVLN